jgi:hypothetical protein
MNQAQTAVDTPRHTPEPSRPPIGPSLATKARAADEVPKSPMGHRPRAAPACTEADELREVA